MKFIDPYPTPEEVAETMKDPKAGIIGKCAGFSLDPCDVSVPVSFLESLSGFYSGDAGDEKE